MGHVIVYIFPVFLLSFPYAYATGHDSGWDTLFVWPRKALFYVMTLKLWSGCQFILNLTLKHKLVHSTEWEGILLPKMQQADQPRGLPYMWSHQGGRQHAAGAVHIFSSWILFISTPSAPYEFVVFFSFLFFSGGKDPALANTANVSVLVLEWALEVSRWSLQTIFWNSFIHSRDPGDL